MHGEGLEWSREQDGCVDLPVCGAGEAVADARQAAVRLWTGP